MPATTSVAPTAVAYSRAGLGASIGGDCRLLIPVAQPCYRHPNRETAVSCSSCGRPICPDCMTPTPVGMRCPECASQRTKVVRGVGDPGLFASAPATFILIGLNIVVFLAEIASASG